MISHHPSTMLPLAPIRRGRWQKVVDAINNGMVVQLTVPEDFADEYELHRQRTLPVVACKRAGLSVTTRTYDGSLWIYPVS